MRTGVFALAGALLLSSCTIGTSQEPVAALPMEFSKGWMDPDPGAINEASYAFGSLNLLRGDPVAALRAIICVEYLPVQSQCTLGIAPHAPPPLVIDSGCGLRRTCTAAIWRVPAH
jgi:hypothetical protein